MDNQERTGKLHKHIKSLWHGAQSHDAQVLYSSLLDSIESFWEGQAQEKVMEEIKQGRHRKSEPTEQLESIRRYVKGKQRNVSLPDPPNPHDAVKAYQYVLDFIDDLITLEVK